ncbi:MAG TPA: cytochrome c3 family protein [Rhodocyclaceae bacterium]|nr:cytochrome c3 family protein [Rhodocyclaceae bacterium]
MRRITIQTMCIVLLGTFGVVSPTFSASDEVKPQTPEMQEKIRKANAECFSCHSAEGLKHPPKEGLDLKKLKGLLQSPEVFKNSDHQRLACTKCHNEGYDEHPHAADAKDSTSTCSDCHSKKADRVEKQFEKSVHAKNMADNFPCTTCHNPHLMRVAEKLVAPEKIVAQDNRVCLGCHDSDEQFAKFAPDKKSRPLIDDIHNWLPNTRLHWKAVRCVECHTPAVAAGEPMSHEILNKDKAEKKCVSCHTGDSSLKTRLYRHLATDEQKKYGFINSVVLSNSYVIGATRHPALDWLMVGLVAATFFGVLAHAALRVLMSYLRRRKNND